MYFNGPNGLCFGQHQIEVDDAIALIIEIFEECGVENMYSTESQFFTVFLLLMDPFMLIIYEVFPSHKAVLVVEKQFARGVAVLGEEPGLVAGAKELFVMVLERGVGEDVNVMDEDGFGVVKKRQGLHDGASGVHELTAFVGKEEFGIERMCFDELYHLLTEMVDVDNDGVEPLLDEVVDVAFEERVPSHFDEGFGLVVGELSQPCSQSRGKKHGSASIHGFSVQYD